MSGTSRSKSSPPPPRSIFRSCFSFRLPASCSPITCAAATAWRRRDTSLRGAKRRSNPEATRVALDCFVAAARLLAMTLWPITQSIGERAVALDERVDGGDRRAVLFEPATLLIGRHALRVL